MFVVHLGRVELWHEANSCLGAKWPRNITFQTQRSGPLLAPVAAFLAISVYDIREREAISPRRLLLSCSPSLRSLSPLASQCTPASHSLPALSFLGTSTCISNKLQYCGITSLSRVMNVCPFSPLAMDIGYWVTLGLL